MNEEEKKAVKFFYNLRATIDESNMLFEGDINVKCGKETIRQITIILNLIEKLQKENKRLKTKIDICNCQEKSFREIIESKYIPKEKIKELIKRKKENIEGLHPASDCVLIDDFETQIDVLKQLLEENNYDE
ncbi:MAG: hypothetical protein MSA15_05420 [Clostridium sp.]|nr:hypothetical protein [Clostridium sp.]